MIAELSNAVSIAQQKSPGSLTKTVYIIAILHYKYWLLPEVKLRACVREGVNDAKYVGGKECHCKE